MLHIVFTASTTTTKLPCLDVSNFQATMTHMHEIVAGMPKGFGRNVCLSAFDNNQHAESGFLLLHNNNPRLRIFPSYTHSHPHFISSPLMSLSTLSCEEVFGDLINMVYHEFPLEKQALLVRRAIKVVSLLDVQFSLLPALQPMNPPHGETGLSISGSKGS